MMPANSAPRAQGYSRTGVTYGLADEVVGGPAEAPESGTPA